MRVSETAYTLFVWSAAVVVAVAFLLWLSEIVIGLVLVLSVLYTAVHLLTRFGEWYTDAYAGDDCATRTPSVSLRSPARDVPDPTRFPRSPAMTPDDRDYPGGPEDDSRWPPDWQLDDAARALSDQDLDDYYGELADDGRGCAADHEWGAEEPRLQALEEAMDGAPEGLGAGDDEDGRW